MGLLRQHTDAVGSTLPYCSGLVTGEPEQSFAEMRPLVRNELDAQVLYHVIDDENTEFVHFVRLVVLERLAEHVLIEHFHDAER